MILLLLFVDLISSYFAAKSGTFTGEHFNMHRHRKHKKSFVREQDSGQSSFQVTNSVRFTLQTTEIWLALYTDSGGMKDKKQGWFHLINLLPLVKNQIFLIFLSEEEK